MTRPARPADRCRSKLGPATRYAPEPNALLALYLERRSSLVRFFTARTGSAAEAEDLVQALYFKVSSAVEYDIRSGVAYLYRLGLNLMVDRYRSAQRGRDRDREYHRTQHDPLRGIEVSDTPSPEEEVDAKMRLGRLLQGVRSLPPQCRRVFQMHKLDGMSHSEVAAALGISRSAVEKHMILALRRLADLG